MPNDENQTEQPSDVLLVSDEFLEQELVDESMEEFRGFAQNYTLPWEGESETDAHPHR